MTAACRNVTPQVALGPKAKPGPHVVSLEVNGQRHYIGTVDKDSNPAFSVRALPADRFRTVFSSAPKCTVLSGCISGLL